jgi:eukaryotic-like serine/threonine-protein kinase
VTENRPRLNIQDCFASANILCQAAAMSKSVDLKHQLRFGPFEVDPNAGELRKGGTRIRLPEQPFKILTLLLLRPGEVVTREEIRKTLWGEDTFVDFERGLNKAVNRLRDVLGESAENPRYIETLPKRGYRLIVPVEAPAVDLAEPLRVEYQQESPRAVDRPSEFKSRVRLRLWIVAAALAAGVAATFLYMRRPAVLTEQDTVVLADFENRTNDPAFDDALKQALSIDLEQSPFLKLLPAQQVADTLRLMLQNPDQHVSKDIARAVCQRTGSKAVLAGSIANLGSEYVIGLDATDCQSGNILAQQQVRANRQEDILAGIDNAASKLRRKLGESLPSIQKYNRPIHEALSTASLDAFQAYANGERLVRREGNYTSVPFFRRAIELDPDFAYAYGALANVYGLAGEANLSTDYSKKAYALRDRVSEWEKFFISFQYELRVTGELDKTMEVGRMWAQTYPRERTAHTRLAEPLLELGDYENAVAELEQSRLLGGGNPIDMSRLSRAYIGLGRWTDAEAVLQEAIGRNPKNAAVRQQMYRLAFLQGDQKLLQAQIEWAARDPRTLARLGHSDTEAYFGHLRKARDLSRAAEESAVHSDFKERAALLHAAEALREAEFGNHGVAGEEAQIALAPSPGSDTQVLAALALAQGGDGLRARQIADDLSNRLPSATLIQNYWLPTIRAQIEIASNNPAKAIELLRRTERYELSSASPMLPVYVRATAFLTAKQGPAAAGEFKKILEHRGVVGNSPIGALAHLGLARAFAMAGNVSEARAAYKNFFALWKDADDNIPILSEARSEFTSITAAQNR